MDEIVASVTHTNAQHDLVTPSPTSMNLQSIMPRKRVASAFTMGSCSNPMCRPSCGTCNVEGFSAGHESSSMSLAQARCAHC